MRPIKLKISAFSSYSGTTVLDMDKLGKNGLYLITGETGAGKTTIFDAVTFALYGKPSGNNRDSKMLRSKYADPDTPTEVVLTFEYKEKVYTVKRIPEYERPAKRGGGVTLQRAEAELILPDGKVISKARDVDAYIRDITGLDREQFSQIAMIAQGDFLKLLTASTEIRQEIFRKLFSTTLYERLQDKLKAELSGVKKEYEAAESSVKQYISGTVCEKNSQYRKPLERAKNAELSFEETKELMKNIIAEDEAAEKALEEEISEIQSKIELSAARLSKAEEYRKAEFSLKAAKEERIKLSDVSTELKKAVDEETKKQPEADSLRREAAIIEAELPRYSELEETITLLAETEKKISEGGKKLKEYETQKSRLTAEAEELSEELKNLENTGELKEKLIREKEQAENEKERLILLEKTAEQYNKIRESLKIKQDFYKLAAEKAQGLSEKYSKQYKAFLNEQAGVLAETLAENEPCPVCGSLHHPEPAQKSPAAPDKEQLKKLEKECKEAEAAANAASIAAGKLNGEFGAVKANLEQQLSAFSESPTVENAAVLAKEKISEIKEAIKALKNKISAEDSRLLRKNELSAAIPEKQKLISDISARAAALKETAAADETLKAQTQKRINRITEKLMFKSAEEARGKIKSNSEAAEKIVKVLETAKEKYRECENSLALLTGKTEQLEKQLSAGCETNIEAESSLKKKLEDERAERTKLQKNISVRISANRTAVQKISEKASELSEIEKRYSYIKNLSDTACGNLSGKEKIMLETYVQAAYFERIIHRANYRLKLMTGGQYELRRRSTAENNRSQSGLELEITDHYNGTVRDVKSLSGGESFKASLALALGLSDEIQSAAGGIKLDTMFIDEGFGSLDENSLQQAINVLSELTGEHRLVGIISHVSELRRRIDKQIVVTKNKSGEAIGTKAEILC